MQKIFFRDLSGIFLLRHVSHVIFAEPQKTFFLQSYRVPIFAELCHLQTPQILQNYCKIETLN